MTKNIIIAALFVISAGSLWKLATLDKKQNNQYEILIYQDHFELKDGNRHVSNLKWGSNPQIDSVIIADNL